MKIFVNNMWCDTDFDWGYKKDEDFVSDIWAEKEMYKEALKSFISYCENPNNRIRKTDLEMCNFLDTLRDEILTLLNNAKIRKFVRK
jgi:hypothetical protein